MIPLSSARRRPASGASYRGAALPPPVPRRAGPALPASGASYRAAARPAVPPRPKRPQANEDPLAAALAPHKAKRPKKASLRERPVTDLGGDDDAGQGPPRRATPRGVALPGESAVFCRERPRVTKEAYAYVARQRAPPQKPPQRRRAPPMRRAPVAKAPAAAPAAAPWLRPLGDDERKRLKASKGAHARQAQAERADRGLGALAKLEKREAAADDAAAKAALSMRVRCFKCLDCARLFESKPEACERRGHTLEMAFGMRRCFACGKCGKSTYSLERRPRGACACGADAWRNRENESDVRAVAAPESFRPALAEWTSTSDVSALVNNI